MSVLEVDVYCITLVRERRTRGSVWYGAQEPLWELLLLSLTYLELRL